MLFASWSEFALGNNEASLAALRRTEQLLPSGAAPSIRGEVAYGYGLLGHPEDAQRGFELVRDLAIDRYVDASTWARVYMAVGDYDEALRRTNIAADYRDLLQDPWPTHFISQNTLRDPILEEPEWIDVRSRLRFRE